MTWQTIYGPENWCIFLEYIPAVCLSQTNCRLLSPPHQIALPALTFPCASTRECEVVQSTRSAHWFGWFGVFYYYYLRCHMVTSVSREKGAGGWQLDYLKMTTKLHLLLSSLHQEVKQGFPKFPLLPFPPPQYLEIKSTDTALNHT